MPLSISPSVAFLVVFLLQVVVVIINLSFTSDSEKRNLAAEPFFFQPDAPIYRFNNPVLAYKVLEQLDVFEPVNVTDKDIEKFSQKIYFGNQFDEDYCKKHRAFIVTHPETIFTEKNIISSMISSSLLRSRVIPEIGRDMQPKKKIYSKTGVQFFAEDANNFFSGEAIFYNRAIGQHFSCLSQSSNTIPGFSYLYRKDYLSEGVVEYAKSYTQRPDCFNYSKFFPETWILYHKDECQEFFQHLNSPEYQQLKKERGEIVYMRKVGAGVHKGNGVFPMNKKEEDNVRAMYKNGALCGKNTRNNIIQYYIYNPLLLHGNKFDFRLYMLIASANPVIAYYYDGFLRVSLHKYDSQSEELGAFLTNTALSKSIFGLASKNGTYEGKTVDELQNHHRWTFQRLEDYLYEQGIITDRNWLDNYLRPEFKKAMAHLVRISQKHFMKKSSVYHLFGLDFMLDETLNLWFIEANAMPALEGLAESKKLVADMLTDHFEIVFGLMRSRMKRVVQFVNELTSHQSYSTFLLNSFKIDELNLRQQQFKKLTENWFESEFEPSPKNKFQPIINDNFVGAGRYFGLLKEECI